MVRKGFLTKESYQSLPQIVFERTKSIQSRRHMLVLMYSFDLNEPETVTRGNTPDLLKPF